MQKLSFCVVGSDSFLADHNKTLLLLAQTSATRCIYIKVSWVISCLEPGCCTCDCWVISSQVQVNQFGSDWWSTDKCPPLWLYISLKVWIKIFNNFTLNMALYSTYFVRCHNLVSGIHGLCYFIARFKNNYFFCSL